MDVLIKNVRKEIAKMKDKILNKKSFIFIVKEAEDDVTLVGKFFEYMNAKEKHIFIKMLAVSRVWEGMTIAQQLEFSNMIVDEYNISRFLALMDYLSKTEGKKEIK